jgi:hypothetical protein
MLRLESRCVVCAGPIVLGLLHIEHRGWKQLDIPDVIGMGMRNGDGLDIGRLEAKLIELSREGLWTMPVNGFRIRWRKPIWHCRHRIGNAGIP